VTRFLFTVDEASELIRAGKALMIAGDEQLLARLPKGRWIGGTIPYFVAENGGLCTQDKLQATELPASVTEVSIARYDATTVANVYSDGPRHGFSLIIIPASSPTHLEFAVRAPQYVDFAQRPLIGWIAGVHVSDIGKVNAKIFDGTTGDALEDGAIVMHAQLPDNRGAEIGIVNIFELGDGPELEFQDDGFSVREALVDGVPKNLAAWVTEQKIDTRLPLVADYQGARVNVSLQKVDVEAGRVDFYAPVFAGVTYRQARPVAGYVEEFMRRLPREEGQQVAWSCNCILNYLYSELEGKKTGMFMGPATFGEIAYQLLNQTLAYLAIHDFT
jgi:hypothetical protein